MLKLVLRSRLKGVGRAWATTILQPMSLSLTEVEPSSNHLIHEILLTNTNDLIRNHGRLFDIVDGKNDVVSDNDVEHFYL